MVNINQSLFTSINQYAGQNALFDNIGIFLAEYSPYLFIALEVYLYFIARKRHEALLAFYSVLLALSINQIIGLFYFHNRPFMDGLGTTLFKHVPENSFPSDHTTFMLAIAFSLLLSSRTRKVGLLFMILGVIGGAFRIFIGVHYPFDIMGGILVGAVSAIIIQLLSERVKFIDQFIFKLEEKIFKREI